MQVIEENPYILKPSDYKKSIISNERFYIQFNFFSLEVEAIFMKIIHRYLEKHDILYLKDMIITVLREIITNAVKANAKRLYFKLMKLDISKKEDYWKGMRSFKADVYSSETDIFDKLKQVNLLVRVLFEYQPDSLEIHIINNSPIIEEELKKIESRINKAYLYNDISEAFDDVMDDSEGAGLGLIMALMLIKNAGLPPETFNIKSEKGLTIATIKTPHYLNKEAYNIKITDEIIKEVNNLPSFPKNIIEIQKLCCNPDATVAEIAESIKKDPGLTTAILKLANSSGYITLNQTNTIEDAVKLIGLKTINSLLIASGVQEILDSRYKKFEEIWTNSYRAAFYAHKLSIQVKKTDMTDSIYLSALLAEIGQIVLLSIKPELTIKIHEVTGKNIIDNSGLLEEMTLGISHSTLGALILEKWNFNQSLVNMIKYHRRPHMAPEKYKASVYLVYLAYSLIDIENRRLRFEFLDEDVLDYYNLNNKEKFEMLHRILKNSYNTKNMGVS